MTREEEINKLTDIWYSIVSLDHHKDRDCHWYINKVWSYGQKPYYQIEHYGYIYGLDREDVDAQYPTYEQAETRLLEIIKDAIEEERARAEEIIETPINWDSDQIERAEGIMKLTDFFI